MTVILKAKISMGKGEKVTISVVNVPPETKVWKRETHNAVLRDTIDFMEKVLKGYENVLLNGNFNIKEVNCENWDSEWGEVETWGGKAYGVDNEQHANAVGYRKETDLQVSMIYRGCIWYLEKRTYLIERTNYRCLVGKSEHMLIEINVLKWIREKRHKAYRNGSYNYGNMDWVGFREFF